MGGGTSLDNPIALTAGTAYTCPCDGYFRIYCNHGSSEYALGYIGSNLMMTGGTSLTTYNPCCSMPVKKGMEIKFSGSTTAQGRFFPII